MNQTLKNYTFLLSYRVVRFGVRFGFLGGSDVSILKDKPRFEVKLSKGLRSSRFSIFRFVPNLLTRYTTYFILILVLVIANWCDWQKQQLFRIFGRFVRP